MGIDNLSGIGAPIPENLPVKNEQASLKSENLVETPSSGKQDFAAVGNQKATPSDDRSYRTKMRDLRYNAPDRLTDDDPRERKIEVKIEKPAASNNSNTSQGLSDAIKEAQKKYPLPKPDDLVKSLSKDTQNEVQQVSRQALADPDLVNPKLFFETLSKMLPLAIAVLNGTEGHTAQTPSTEVSAMLIQMMKDLSPHIDRLLAAENLPKDLMDLLQRLSQQLASAPKLAAETSTNGTVVDKSMLLTTEQLMTTLQSESAPKTKALHLLSTHLNLLLSMSGVLTLARKEQAEFIQTLFANQLLFSAEKSNIGMLGQNTQELAGKISEMVLALAGKISEAVHVPLLKESGSQGLLKLFSSILFGGTLLGKMIADRGDGKAWGLDEAYAGMLQMQSVKELKIFDLVPFSLFTAFSPFRKKEGLTKEQKDALNLLRELIHQLMNLVFLITATYSAGQKIGPGGIEYLLEKNSVSIKTAIEPLMITLLKVHEIFSIDIKAPFAYLKQSVDAIVNKDHSAFWSNIFAFFTDENDLNTFLEEVDELDPFYQSIHFLMLKKH